MFRLCDFVSVCVWGGGGGGAALTCRTTGLGAGKKEYVSGCGTTQTCHIIGLGAGEKR